MRRVSSEGRNFVSALLSNFEVFEVEIISLYFTISPACFLSDSTLRIFLSERQQIVGMWNLQGERDAFLRGHGLEAMHSNLSREHVCALISSSFAR